MIIMQNQEIYEGALRLISESMTDGENEDYKDRASYLIAAFCSETEELDRSMRKRLGIEARESFNPVWISLEDEFPSVDRLAPAACLYVAAMLILDDDPERSDSLYDKYCDSIASLETSFPMSLETIRDSYCFD